MVFVCCFQAAMTESRTLGRHLCDFQVGLSKKTSCFQVERSMLSSQAALAVICALQWDLHSFVVSSSFSCTFSGHPLQYPGKVLFYFHHYFPHLLCTVHVLGQCTLPRNHLKVKDIISKVKVSPVFVLRSV